MGYILLAIFLFGILIAVHELGHFLAARLCGVRVLEFSIGMGPALWQRSRNGTDYSLRLFPIGGYCAMEGEDEASDRPDALNNQSPWKKCLIFAAGAGMNFLTGFLIVLLLYANAEGFYTPTIVSFSPEFENPNQSLQVGDTLWKIDGKRVFVVSDVSLLLSHLPDEPVELVVERDGEKIRIPDFPLQKGEYSNVDGERYTGYGFQIYGILKATPLVRLQVSWYNTLSFVQTVWISLLDLVTGIVGLEDMSGPVGIVDTISDVGEQSESTKDALFNIFYLAALIAVNLAVMNLLPLPALDGGRIFFLLVNGLAMLLVRRQIPAKYEGYIHMAGLVLLLGFMVLVTYQDILRIFA